MFNLTNSKRLVILSAEQAGETAAFNASRTEYLRDTLAGYLRTGQVDSVIRCNGQYQGTPEASFAVVCDERVVVHLANVAELLNQECILVAHNNDGDTDGVLLFPNGHRVRVGTLQLCTPRVDYEASTEIHGTDIVFTFA